MELKPERRRRLWAVLPATVACVIALGCAQAPKGDATFHNADRQDQTPLIRLAPATLGKTLSEQQRLTIIAPSGQTTQLAALLEADSHSVRLAFLQVGHVVARLEWDGQNLETSQARQWPKDVSAERILSDLQLARWPLQAVQSALRPPWSMKHIGNTRHLRQDHQDRVLFRTGEGGRTDIEYLHSGWRLSIQSHPTDSGETP